MNVITSDPPTIQSTARDAEGWIIPAPRRIAPNKQPPEEAANQRRLVGALTAHGWRISEHHVCYNRDGGIMVPDFLVWHQEMRAVGAIEVKSSIKTPRHTADALKQCFDYTQCKTMDGTRVEWGAIFPFDPAGTGHHSNGLMMWGSANFAAAHLKVAVFMDEEAYRRWDATKPHGNGYVRDPDRIRLQYQEQNRAYCTKEGFVANAEAMLLGKRKIGGRRM